MATYTVYVLSYKSMPIFHEGLYIEEKTGKGWLYHVIGGHGPGWKYETKECNDIESSTQFHAKYAKGTIAGADLDLVDSVCRAIGMPSIEHRQGVQFRRDCRHWVRKALDDLQKQGIFQPNK